MRTHRFVAAVIAALIIGTTQKAHATNKPPTPTPPPASTSSSNAKSDASAKASATGGESDATGGNASIGGFTDDSRLYVLPAPMYAPPMALVPCPSANIDLKGGAIGWNFASGYHHTTDSSDCTLIQMRNAKVEMCQYASAKQIEDLLTQKYLPAYKPSANDRFVDLTPAECAALKAPVIKPKDDATLLIGPGLKKPAVDECVPPPPAAQKAAGPKKDKAAAADLDCKRKKLT